MTDDLVFDETTTFKVGGTQEIQDVHLEELSFILDIQYDSDGHVDNCEIDLRNLVKALTLYTSMEQFRHDWRRRSSPPQQYDAD